MSKVMTASEFVKKLKDVAENYKTLYVMGCFGAPMTAANKKRYIAHHSYNQQETRTKMINAATADTFGFDCVNLIKGILWGWNGDKTKSYGGAKYAVHGVPDTSADGMFNLCTDKSSDFTKIEVGEAVWTNGHIGVYIGGGLSVECTPAWKNRVQITACNCSKSGYNTRKWKKHGKLPFIEYDVVESTTSKPTTKPESTTKPKVDAAQKFDKSLAGKYKVTASVGLHMRTGADVKKTSLMVLKSGAEVVNYGYYSVATNNSKWLYVVDSKTGTVGFCSSRYLKKC